MTDQEVFLEQLKLASELHRHMDAMASQRFNYFIAVNAVLVPALTLIWFSDMTDTSNTLDWKLAFTAVIAAFGVVTSLVWCFVHKRTQIYHALRCRQAGAAEEKLLGCEATDPERVRVYEKGSRLQNEAAREVPKAWFGRRPDYDLMWTIPASLAVVWFLALATAFATLLATVSCPLPSSTVLTLVIGIVSVLWIIWVFVWIIRLPEAWGCSIATNGKEESE